MAAAQREIDALRQLGETAPAPEPSGGALAFEITEMLPDGRLFSFQATVEGGDSGPVVTKLVVWAEDGIDSSVLRAIKPAQLIRITSEQAVRVMRTWVAGLESDDAHRAQELLARIDAAKPRRGRPRLDDAFLRDVAEEYLRTQEELRGTRRSVIATIAERRFVESTKTVENWIRRAAEAQFLSKAKKGRAGRLPGARLLEPSSEEKQP